MIPEKQGVSHRTSWGFRYNVIDASESARKRLSESFTTNPIPKKVKNNQEGNSSVHNMSILNRMSEHLDRELELSEKKRASLGSRINYLNLDFNNFFSKHLGEDDSQPKINFPQAEAKNLDQQQIQETIQSAQLQKPASKQSKNRLSNDLNVEDMMNHKTQMFFGNEVISANNPKPNNEMLTEAASKNNPQNPPVFGRIEEQQLADKEIKPTPVNPTQKKSRSGSGQRVPKPSEIIHQVFNTLRQIKVKEFLDTQKLEFMAKLKANNLNEYDSYRVTRLKPTEDIKELNGRKLDFPKFIKIFNRIADYELINLKGQRLFQIDAYTIFIKAIKEFMREGIDQATKEVQESLKVVIEKPNLKNIFYTEHNQILRGLIEVFHHILSQLEEIDLDRKSQISVMCQNINRHFDKIKANAKILTVNQEMIDEINQKNSIITEKHLKNFHQACQVLEKGFDDLHELIAEIEKMDRKNELNYQKIYKSYYEPLAPVFEASPVDLVKDWLAGSINN